MVNEFHLIINCSKKLEFLLTIFNNILFIFRSNSKLLDLIFIENKRLTHKKSH